MAVCSLSEEEFGRLQTQFLKLKEENYCLDDQCKCQEKELIQLREQVAHLNQELLRSNKVLNVSRKAREFEFISHETECMKRKLLSQEDEFRLQNETLMTELGQLLMANEALEKKVRKLEGWSQGEHAEAGVSVEVTQLKDEVQRLEAENSALHSALHCKSESFTMIDSCSSVSVDISQQALATPDLQLMLETEKANEKIMLANQLRTLKESSKQEIIVLQDKVDALSNKLKMKHESFLTLQQEKESQLQGLMRKMEEICDEKDKELRNVVENCSRLENELISVRKIAAENDGSLEGRCAELEVIITDQQHQLSLLADEQTCHLAQHVAAADLAQQRISKLTADIDDLQAQLKESHAAQIAGAEHLVAMEMKLEQLCKTLYDTEMVAESRKSVIDKVAVEHQQESDALKCQLENLMELYQNLLTENSVAVNQLAAKASELELVQVARDELHAKVEQLQTVSNSLEMQLKEIQDKFESEKEEWSAHKLKYEECIAALTADHARQIETLQQTVDDQQSSISDLNNTITKLQQDHEEAKKIHEMKGASMLKELKKQIQSERNRADHLQEKLQQFLSESAHSQQTMDDLLTSVRRKERKTEDGSVVVDQSADEDGWTLLRQENDELLRRMTELQQQSCMLGEKVTHLESSNASMANDLLSKTAIIQHYMMDGRQESGATNSPSSLSDKNALRRVIDYVRETSDDNLRDINRKLQRVLEETLTKNMHLQKDLETMSEEIMRLNTPMSSV